MVESGPRARPGSRIHWVLTARPQPAGLGNESTGERRVTGTPKHGESISLSPAVGLALCIYNACLCFTFNVQITALHAIKDRVAMLVVPLSTRLDLFQYLEKSWISREVLLGCWNCWIIDDCLIRKIGLFCELKYFDYYFGLPIHSSASQKKTLKLLRIRVG